MGEPILDIIGQLRLDISSQRGIRSDTVEAEECSAKCDQRLWPIEDQMSDAPGHRGITEYRAEHIRQDCGVDPLQVRRADTVDGYPAAQQVAESRRLSGVMHDRDALSAQPQHPFELPQRREHV